LPNPRSARFVIACIAIYVVVFSIFTIGRHDRYNSTAWDLAFNDQVLWNTAHGRFMQLSLFAGPTGNNWMSHVEPILILLAPIKLILPDVRWLLIIQTAALALGAWPAYRIAARRTGRPAVAALFALLYLLYPVLHWANKFDFHPLAFVPALLLLAFDLFETQHDGLMSVCLLLALGCKEEMGLIVMMFGLYVAIRGQRWRIGLAWAALGLAWFLLSAFVILPSAQAASPVPIQGWSLKRYDWLFKGDLAAKIAFVTGPDTAVKLRFLVQLLAPLAFLPLLYPEIAILGAPSLALALLSSSLNQSGIFHQYMLPVVPFLMIAAIYALDRAQRRLTMLFRRLHLRFRNAFAERLVLIMATALTLVSFVLYNPFLYVPREPYTPIYGWEPGASVAALEKARTLIPSDGCLVAANNIAAHYSDRVEIYLPDQYDPPGCRYVLLDLADQRFMLNGEDYVCSRLQSGEYLTRFYENGVILLERRSTAPDSIPNPDICGKR
jgi:uncharacterized membrane protein